MYNKYLKILKNNKCACWFENGELIQECHYHACMRAGRNENGDPLSWVKDGKETTFDTMLGQLLDERGCGSDNASWIVLVDKSRSTGKKLDEIKPPEKEKEEKDTNYNPKDYPNEVNLPKLTDKIPSLKFVKRPKNPNCKVKPVTRVKESGELVDGCD